MGMLQNGRWVAEDIFLENGAFQRETSPLNGEIRLDAEAAQDEPDRYWLIASLSCPWSHRTLLAWSLFELKSHVNLHIAHGPRIEGYAIDGGAAWPVPGHPARITYLHQLYTLHDAGYSGRATVPLLWDAKSRFILSNESCRITRAFEQLARERGNDGLWRPYGLEAEIDAIGARLYSGLTNAVYRAGFATSQTAYDEAIDDVFETLDWLERRLTNRRYLLGPFPLECDWYLFPTLVRFDAVYATLHFCNRKRLTDYPNLWAYARDLYQTPGVRETVDLKVSVEASYANDTAHNPHSIVPPLPDMDWDAPHGRDGKGAEFDVIWGDKR